MISLFVRNDYRETYLTLYRTKRDTMSRRSIRGATIIRTEEPERPTRWLTN